MDDRILAHGLGGARDLPIPLGTTIIAAVVALAVSFTVLALAWREPRYDAAALGRPQPRLGAVVDHPATGIALRVFGMVLFLYTAMVAIFGQDLLTNPIFGLFYVWWWVGLVPVSVLFGPVWKAISPVRTINRAFAAVSGSDPDQGVFTYPERLGHWPAALGLLAFVWMELIYPFNTELSAVRLWCAAYVAVMLLGGALFGNTFYERADPFEVYSTLAGKLSVWGRRTDGTFVVCSPLANLSTLPVRPGLTAVGAVLFGSTAFDSFKDSQTYLTFIQRNDFISTHSWAPNALNNLTLVAFCVGVGLIFAIGTMLTGVGPETRRTTLPNQFAHSIVPIIVGYVIAHYLTYLIEVGQDTLIKMSDPFGDGSNYLGTGNWSIDYWLTYHPTLLANLKVLAVVLGHVVGVIAAHDRAVRLLPKRHQLTGQLPLLLAMIAFTVGGLYLLFSA